MQCYTTENLVREDLILHRSSTKGCTESMKDTFVMSVLSKFLVQLKFEGVCKKMQYLDDFLTF